MIDHDPELQAAVELIGKRWTGAIVWALRGGPVRFNQLLNGIPDLSDRVLSLRLEEMAEAGLVVRAVAPGPPTRITYRLTDKGRALRPVLEATQEWARAVSSV